jgi:WD40-like Beta Propeller Repeat
MTRRLPHRCSSACVVALFAWCCRERGVAEETVARPMSATQPMPAPSAMATPGETAALMAIDAVGATMITCLPSRKVQADVFRGTPLLEILDTTTANGKPLVAALAAPMRGRSRAAEGRLVLLAPGAPPRSIAEGIHVARFSPQGDALLVESRARKHVGGGALGTLSSSRVVDLGNGQGADIGDYADPRWEADGQHVRATRLLAKLKDRRTHVTGQWSLVRVRWARATGAVVVLGPGGAQLPAPRGTAATWSDEPLRSPLLDRCHLSLGHGPVHQHPATGPVCQGIVDDRAMRWSPDGHWLAFASYPSSPGNPRGTDLPAFFNIVASSGEPHPAMALLKPIAEPTHGTRARRANVGYPWLDWSPSQRHLVAQDSDERLWLYDLVTAGVTPLGDGRRPTWSPQGEYLLVRAPAANRQGAATTADAFVLPQGSVAGKIVFGAVKDIRWISPFVCAGGA